MLNMTQTVLPNLRWLGFRGANAYAETLLPYITTPLLEKLDIIFSKTPFFSTPCLLHFVRPTEDLRFGGAAVLHHHPSPLEAPNHLFRRPSPFHWHPKPPTFCKANSESQVW